MRQNSPLTGKLLEAQEEERRRIGRDLHDGFSQQLAMFVVELGLLARKPPADATTLMESILDLRQRAECLSNDLRRISHQLHPAVLEHLGLQAALRSLCNEVTSHCGVRVWFSADEKLGRFPRNIAICMYRITQEALRNVVKHSGAREEWVRISHTQNDVQLSIIDRGAGFNLGSSHTAGLGLISMKERASIIRGDFHIESGPAEGTAIRITVPAIWKEKENAIENTASEAHAAAG